ncbi:hypothetical protein [Ilumatobacter sp.]|uniref:hypothetical protein n=1 Tax=Ilumatobacter sp. TaxID=1967498 RepID=UPI003C4ECB27
MMFRKNPERFLLGTRLVGIAGIALGVGLAATPSAAHASSAPVRQAPSERCILVLCPGGEVDIDLDLDIDLPILGDPAPTPTTTPTPSTPAPTPTTPPAPTPSGNVVDVDLDLGVDVGLGNVADVSVTVPADVAVSTGGHNGGGAGGGVLGGPPLLDVDAGIEPAVDIDLLPQAGAPLPVPGMGGDGTDGGDVVGSLVDLDADLICGLSFLVLGPSDVRCGGAVLGDVTTGLVDVGLDVDICDISVSVLSPAEEAECASAATDDGNPGDDGDPAVDTDGADDDSTSDGNATGDSGDAGAGSDGDDSSATGAGSGSDDASRGIVTSDANGPGGSLPLTGNTPLLILAAACVLLAAGTAVRVAGSRHNPDPVD